MTSENTLTSESLLPQERKIRPKGRSKKWAEHSSRPIYEYRYFKDERGRSVQLRRLISELRTSGTEAAWEPIPSQSSSYTTFDNSRLTYARSAGLPSLGKKYAPGHR